MLPLRIDVIGPGAATATSATPLDLSHQKESRGSSNSSSIRPLQLAKERKPLLSERQ